LFASSNTTSACAVAVESPQAGSPAATASEVSEVRRKPKAPRGGESFKPAFIRIRRIKAQRLERYQRLPEGKRYRTADPRDAKTGSGSASFR
jgi:hypothetical protein